MEATSTLNVGNLLTSEYLEDYDQLKRAASKVFSFKVSYFVFFKVCFVKLTSKVPHKKDIDKYIYSLLCKLDRFLTGNIFSIATKKAILQKE